MSSQGILLSWIPDLTDTLNTFQNQVSPIEDEYQTTWGTFQNIMYNLLTPASGPDAFSGEASRAIHNAFNACQLKERGFQQMDIPDNGKRICQTCVTGIDQAITENSPRMTDPSFVEEALSYMSVDDIVKYGREMVPAFLAVQATLSPYLDTVRPLDAKKKQEEFQTYEALLSMADQIQAAATTWDSSMSSLANTPVPTEFLELVAEDEGKIETALDLAGKLGEPLDIEPLKNLDGKMKAGGPLLAAIEGLLEFISGKQHTPKALFSDLFGAGLTLLPGVNVAAFYLALVKDGAPVLADEQDGYARFLGYGDPALRGELEQPAEGLRAGSEQIEFSETLDDIGGTVYDLLPIGNEPESQRLLTASVDFQRAVVDMQDTTRGAQDVGVNAAAAMLDDGVAVEGDLLPGSRGIAKTVIGRINNVAKCLNL